MADETVITPVPELLVKEHMDVSDAYGQYVGTVESIDGDRMRLTRPDRGGHASEFLALEHVDSIQHNRVYLKQGAPLPIGTGAPR
jgi:hypothetical protein